MIYTARFAHLDSVAVSIDEVVRRGRPIGVMGNTGSGTGAHLHLDVVEGEQTGRYTLEMVANGHPKPSPKQSVLFVDNELFGTEPVVTTNYADILYYKTYGKVHCGFDLVPHNRHKNNDNYTIYWNRSVFGKVVQILKDDPGYGNCVMVSFEI